VIYSSFIHPAPPPPPYVVARFLHVLSMGAVFALFAALCNCIFELVGQGRGGGVRKSSIQLGQGRMVSRTNAMFLPSQADEGGCVKGGGGVRLDPLRWSTVQGDKWTPL